MAHRNVTTVCDLKAHDLNRGLVCITLFKKFKKISYIKCLDSPPPHLPHIEICVYSTTLIQVKYMAKNTAKYLSYAEAWRRITASITHGYYFEAVTLCESILSDRLLSYVLGKNPTSKLNVNSHFSQLISEWRKLANNLPDYGETDLGKAVDLWRVNRNKILHSLTKSLPGNATEDVKTFIDRAEEAARTGADLARKVSKWHKTELAKTKKII